MDEGKLDCDHASVWANIYTQADRIAFYEEKMGGWDELIDMCAEILAEAYEEKDLRLYYWFFWLLAARVSRLSSPQPFNQVDEFPYRFQHEEEPAYRITNYSFNMFKRIVRKGAEVRKWVGTDSLLVPIRLLTPAERLHFEKKCNHKL